MGHKFDAKNRRKLDSEERRKILPPFEILKKVGLREGHAVADIGCGTGYFTIPASEIVGPHGVVYAMDILPEMLEEVDKKVSEQGISNIKTVQTAENDFKIKTETATYAFISNVLHEAEDKTGFLAETKRVLTGQGRVAIIEWQKKNGEFGPPVDHRLGMGEVEQMLQDRGFCNIRGMELGEHFYAVLAQK